MGEYRYELFDGEFVGGEDAYFYPRYSDVVGPTPLPPDAARDDALMRFGVWYQGVHGYVCVVMCLFGIVSNAMNIAVLTRRSMVFIYRSVMVTKIFTQRHWQYGECERKKTQ